MRKKTLQRQAPGGTDGLGLNSSRDWASCDRTFKECGVEGNRMQDLHIEVRHQDIVVTMPGTNLRVVYRKPHRGSQLVPRLDYFQDQQKGPITRAKFLAHALKAANHKARELGWIA